MQKFLQEKLKLEKQRKKRSDIIIKLFLIIFVLGYTVFFTSPYYMPNQYHFKETIVFGKTYYNNAHTFSCAVDRWDFYNKDKKFLIFTEVNSVKKPIFRLKVGEDTYFPNVKCIDGKYYLLTFKKISKNWLEATLYINLESDTIKLSTNNKAVSIQETIAKLDDKQCIKYAKEGKVKGLQQYSTELQSKLNKLAEDKTKLYEKLTDYLKIEEPSDVDEKQVYLNQKNKLVIENTRVENDMQDYAHELEKNNATINQVQIELQQLK